MSAYALEAYDEKLINFTKEFTLKAYLVGTKLEEGKKDLDSTAEPVEVTGIIERNPAGEVLVPSAEALYGLPRLWTLQQDDSPLQVPLLEQVTGAFKDIIAAPSAARFRYQYLYLCVENLKSNRSVPQSLSLANYLMAMIHKNKPVHKTSIQEVMKKLSKDYNLTDLILNGFKHYETHVMAAVAKGLRQENIGDSIILGKYKHSSNLDLRFIFMEFVLRYGSDEIKLGKENLLKLWRLFIEESGSEFDTRQFLRWLSNDKETTSNVIPSSVLSAEENLVLFDTLCGARAKLANGLGLSYLKCFANTFKLVNMSAGGIEIKKGRMCASKLSALQGLDALWENVCQSTVEASRSKFAELLIEVYTANLHEDQTFLDRCMRGLIKAETERDELTIGNLIRLLQQLFDLMDGKRFESADDSSDVHKFQITLICKPGKRIVRG